MAIYQHENFIAGKGDEVLWRYLSLEKLESLFQRSSLFFARIDQFPDPFEGSIPVREFNYREIAQRRVAEILGREYDEKLARSNIEGLSNLHQRLRRSVLVNCWHTSNYESQAMWGLYASQGKGIAIKTSHARIVSAVEEIPERISYSYVRYLDYDSDIWHHPIEYPHTAYNLYIPFIHKRKEYEHEKEFRLIHMNEEAINDENFWKNQEKNAGLFIKVNLPTLIEEIWLAPSSNRNTENAVRSLFDCFGYDFRLIPSKLLSPPLF